MASIVRSAPLNSSPRPPPSKTPAVTRYLFFLGAGLSVLGFIIMVLSVVYFVKSACCGLNSSVAHRFRTFFVLTCWVAMCGAVGLIAFEESTTFYNVSVGGILFLAGLGVFVAFAAVSFLQTPATSS